MGCPGDKCIGASTCRFFFCFGLAVLRLWLFLFCRGHWVFAVTSAAKFSPDVSKKHPAKQSFPTINDKTITILASKRRLKCA